MTGWFRRIYNMGRRRQRVLLTDPFEKLRQTLEERMNPDSGILERLVEKEILVEQEVEKIKGKPTARERNAKILEYISKKNQLNEFIKALKETDHELFVLIKHLETTDEVHNAANHRLTRSGSNDRIVMKSKMQKLRKRNTMEKKNFANRTVNDLPINVLDLILMKTILIKAFNTEQLLSTRHRHIMEVVAQLRTVRSTWHDRVDANWFKATLKGLLERPVCRLQNRITVADDWICGVTKLRETIYVLCQWSRSIRVFNDKCPFQLQHEIILEEIKKPRDFAASDRNNCLYVSDGSCKCIWKIGLEDKIVGKKDAPRETLWLDNICSPFTLSLTRDGHVITVTWEHPSGLDIFGPEANPICHLSLPTDIEFPLHAVETSAGNFVVSHMWKNSWTWTVTEVTRYGKPVRRFDPVNKQLLFNWPRHLALDSNDRVFVSDCENDRVILLDSELNLCNVVLARGAARIARPDRIHYDADNLQLIVAHFEGKVDVCKFIHIMK